MRRLVVLLLLLAPSSVDAAEDILVVSGEHDGYTRLVFTVSPDQSWTLNTTNASAVLRFDTPDLTFESSRVFDRITTSRLEAVQLSGGESYTSFKAQLGCDCEVTAVPYLEKYVVVDIADRKPQERQRVVLEPEIWMTPVAPRYVNGSLEVNFPTQLGDSPTLGYLTTQAPDGPPARMNSNKTEDLDGSVVGEDVRKIVDIARSSLLQQVLGAADQGLLDLTRSTPEEESSFVSGAEHPEQTWPLVVDSNQVTIQTVFDRDAGVAPKLGEGEKVHCPQEEALNIASWAEGKNFADEISITRKYTIKEFDQPHYAALELLVKTYLRYGFGAEARQYLLEYGPKISDDELLLDMAAIVDGYPVQLNGPFSQATLCEGAVGLWAMVGKYPDVRGSIGDLDTIINAFTKLPLNIRRILGPRLVSALIDRGEAASARLVSDILERAAGENNDDHKLMLGNLMLVEGHDEGALNAYQTLSEGNSPMAVDALIEMASLRLDMDQPLPSMLGDLNAAVGMWRGTKKEIPLRKLEALWIARVVGGAEAVEMLGETFDKEPALADLLGQTALEIIRNMPMNAQGYAETIYSYQDRIPTDRMADELRLVIADRLILEGLPDFAIDMLVPLVKRANTAATVTTSRAHLNAFRSEKALSVLANVAGDQAKILRVEAFLSDSDFEGALNELQEFENRSAAVVHPRWYAGNWADIVLANSAAKKIRNGFFLIPTERQAISTSGDEQPITLSSIQEILDSSRSMSDELRSEILR